MDIGYMPDFLRRVCDSPCVSTDTVNDAFPGSEDGRIDYMHFSLAVSKERKVARWVAWNIDGPTLRQGEFGRRGLRFKPDPRVPLEYQLLDDVYDDNRLDKGHIARRVDLIWGTDAEAQQGNADSFYFTNITPQMDDFNQSARGGVWGKLENALLKFRELDDGRVSAFGGPVLDESDPKFRDVRIPRSFWKVLAYTVDGELRARCFILTQVVRPVVAPSPLGSFATFQVMPADIEARASIVLPREIHMARADRSLDANARQAKLRSVDDIEW